MFYRECLGEFQLSNEQKLKFYGYYKQVTVGVVNTPQPYFFNVFERAKWDAWYVEFIELNIE